MLYAEQISQFSAMQICREFANVVIYAHYPESFCVKNLAIFSGAPKKFCFFLIDICSPIVGRIYPPIIGRIYPIPMYKFNQHMFPNWQFISNTNISNTGAQFAAPKFSRGPRCFSFEITHFLTHFLTNLSEKHKIIFLNRINLGANSQKLFPYPK